MGATVRIQTKLIGCSRREKYVRSNAYMARQKELVRRSVNEEMLAPLKVKPVEPISVSELGVKAGVSRKVFHRHFENL